MGSLDCKSLEASKIMVKIENGGGVTGSKYDYSKTKCHKTDKYYEITVDKIVKSFNTWFFKREQPDSVEKLSLTISRAVKLEQPISFVLYWGRGPRFEKAHPDIRCLNYLNEFVNRITNIYKGGAAITLIFTDTHARLNGFSSESTARYFKDIAQSASQFNFKFCFLGDLVQSLKAPHPRPENPSDDMIAKLSLSAAKWYQGTNAPHIAARTYYAMNMIEKRAVEAAFPDAIFITFNVCEMRELFPYRLSIFYMYSLKRGTSVKPWFLPASSDADVDCPVND